MFCRRFGRHPPPGGGLRVARSAACQRASWSDFAGHVAMGGRAGTVTGAMFLGGRDRGGLLPVETRQRLTRQPMGRLGQPDRSTRWIRTLPLHFSIFRPQRARAPHVPAKPGRMVGGGDWPERIARVCGEDCGAWVAVGECSNFPGDTNGRGTQGRIDRRGGPSSGRDSTGGAERSGPPDPSTWPALWTQTPIDGRVAWGSADGPGRSTTGCTAVDATVFAGDFGRRGPPTGPRSSLACSTDLLGQDNRGNRRRGADHADLQTDEMP